MKLLKIIESGQVGHKVYLADGQILTFDCAAKSKHKPPVWDFRVSICVQVAFNLESGSLFMYLCGVEIGGHFMTFTCRYFSPKLMVIEL